ncbi:MAG: hypothetical protein MZV49_22540 [Rhodopseudomonas palustris]|nr:hypothetical protein [Rhodopseudomonas palustris]
MPKVGPRGLEFARARVEMKAVRDRASTCAARLPRKIKNMVPAHVLGAGEAMRRRAAGLAERR